jgi:hypothetical protein
MQKVLYVSGSQAPVSMSIVRSWFVLSSLIFVAHTFDVPVQ